MGEGLLPSVPGRGGVEGGGVKATGAGGGGVAMSCKGWGRFHRGDTLMRKIRVAASPGLRPTVPHGLCGVG